MGSIRVGHLGGLDKVFKNPDQHHQTCRQILHLKSTKTDIFTSISFRLPTKWSPNLYLILDLFRPFRPKKGPSKSSDQIFTYFNALALSRSTKPEIFMSLYLSIPSQSGLQKASGWVRGRIPHFNWSIYRGDNSF